MNKLTFQWHLVFIFTIICTASFSQKNSFEDSLLKKAPFGTELIEAYVPFVSPSVTSEGQRHLSYELRISNLHRNPLKLKRVEICDMDNEHRVIATLDSSFLNENLQRPGMPRSNKVIEFPGGQFGILNIRLHLNEEEIPKSFYHKMYFEIEMRTGETVEVPLEKAVVNFTELTSLTLSPPFNSGNWFYYTQGHLNTHELSEGHLSNAQRFAIDWVYLENDGTFVTGDRSVNENFPTYNQDLLAVADGIVVDIQDKIPDNMGESEKRAVKLTRYNLSGNYIIIDIGNNAHAVYAHLIPESFNVKIGDKVKAGDLIAKLGNSGESTGPHLHFHLETKSKMLLGGQGLPYHFAKFEDLGKFEDLEKWRPYFSAHNYRSKKTGIFV